MRSYWRRGVAIGLMLAVTLSGVGISVPAHAQRALPAMVRDLYPPKCGRRTLHNIDKYIFVSLPQRYVHCRIDIVGVVMNVQTLPGASNFVLALDDYADGTYPAGINDMPLKIVFALDYRPVPIAPRDSVGAFVRVVGVIEAAAEAWTPEGNFTGYLPQVRIRQGWIITEHEARARGF
jgi:hypothetical protein